MLCAVGDDARPSEIYCEPLDHNSKCAWSAEDIAVQN